MNQLDIHSRHAVNAGAPDRWPDLLVDVEAEKLSDSDLGHGPEGAQARGEDDKQSTLVALQLRELLRSEGVKPFRQVKLVCDTLGVIGRTARRKLSGETALSEDELEKILGQIGYEYRGLEGIRKKSDLEEGGRQREARQTVFDAMVEVCGKSMPCKVHIRTERSNAPAARNLVLVKNEDGSHRLTESASLSDSMVGMLVEKIEIDNPFVYEGTGATLLVIDEDETGASVMASALTSAGFKAKAVSTREALEQSLQEDKPDAFLVTWNSWAKWPAREISELLKSKSEGLIAYNIAFSEQEKPEMLSDANKYAAEVIVQPASSTLIAWRLVRRMREENKRRMSERGLGED